MNDLNKEFRRRNRVSDGDDDLEFNGEFLGVTKRYMKSTNVSFAIDEYVREPKYYRQVAEELMNLTEHDIVQIRINSVGGRIDGLITLMEAVRQTEANVLAVIAGECHSAASILALNCPQIMVTPYATMMIHNASYGAIGKDSDIVAQVSHFTKFSRSLMEKTYKHFLTDDELEDVINGREIWLDASEIEQRLTNRQKFYEKELKRLEKEAKVSNRKPKREERSEREEIQVSNEVILFKE